MSNQENRTFYLILHNIRSVHNVGAIFRTADAIGVTKIFCTGVTPTPFDRFGRMRKDFAKTSLGAEKTVVWEHSDIKKLIARLKKESVQLIALEQAPGSVDYKKVTLKSGCAILLGSETEGLPPEIVAEMDCVAEIPMRGEKESLNVAVAAGVALYRFFDY